DEDRQRTGSRFSSYLHRGHCHIQEKTASFPIPVYAMCARTVVTTSAMLNPAGKGQGGMTSAYLGVCKGEPCEPESLLIVRCTRAPSDRTCTPDCRRWRRHWPARPAALALCSAHAAPGVGEKRPRRHRPLPRLWLGSDGTAVAPRPTSCRRLRVAVPWPLPLPHPPS